ncbi:hypothetical protein AB0I82_27825 [Streptomyces sp. NPDC050315]|uniref:hypothetical protein n=1 Tax=Streptomyces sp. NPDC050315 TaxID=3155039 RepID=UPI003415C159
MHFHDLEQQLAGPMAAAAATAYSAHLLEQLSAGMLDVPVVRHPLGFVCLPVVRDGELGVCLHFFGHGTDTEPGVEPHHAHSWDLISHVLYGRVAHEPMDVTGSGEPTHRIYEVLSKADGTDEVNPTDTLVHGEPHPPQVCTAGETYRLPAGLFHASRSDGPAATLVLGRSRPGGRDLSLGPVDAGPRGRITTRRHCAEADTPRLARTALRSLHDR